MEINKQLFEDVLSGKLKGTFVLRNGITVSSDKLIRTDGFYQAYAFEGMSYVFGCNGETPVLGCSIINFMPYTDMKENKLTIEIPDGKIVDWRESKKQNKIVLKDKQLTYKEICNELFNEKDLFYINKDGYIKNIEYNKWHSEDNFRNQTIVIDTNNATTKHQLECILAKNKLANVAKYLNGGWKPNKTSFGHFDAWVLYVTPDKDYIGYVKIRECAHNSNVLFKSSELAKQAIEILGEETVKLALEPLGI